MNFTLKARDNRSDAQTIRLALGQLSAKGSVRKAGDEFVVEGEMDGPSAKELNRTFLSALRKVEKRIVRLCCTGHQRTKGGHFGPLTCA